MAKTGAVWGIDIGQCALKALRCHAGGGDGKIVADAFDYIEYPKILSQAGAEPAELIGDALKQFLSRNSVKGDRVAVSVSGQSGLARFIKLPPVEASKIPDIVRYEARQQIPFDLNDVIWDYQRMGVGSVEEGFALETEIGLFAMKRDAVFRALEPFQKANIDIDFVQLTPLALYNFLLFDQLGELPPADEYDPEDPPESVVVLSLGTDSTDLVVTNGYRVWQRSIPIGGNHFTKSLTKELKLTFAKAEHLKRNAASAEDPKAVFQAMRPVFNDLLTELQRSIGYFTSLDRHAKIGRIVGLGNAMKLPGLRRYLAQSLGFEVIRLKEYENLEGADVIGAPAFKENVPCFGVCYGLALQGLGTSGVTTNLLPREILTERMIQQKKPWAVAAAAVLLLGCAINYAWPARSASNVADDLWQTARGQASSVASQSSTLVGEETDKLKLIEDIDLIGQNLVQNVENRVLWLELLQAINACLPRDPQGPQPKDPATIDERPELHITAIECSKEDDLSKWFEAVEGEGWYVPPEEPEEEEEEPEVADPDADETDPAEEDPMAEEEEEEEPLEDPEGPSDEGWIVKITGHHYHNFNDPSRSDQLAKFIQDEFIQKLRTGTVTLPGKDRKTPMTVSMKDLGISYPVLINPGMREEETLEDPNATADEKFVKALRFDFLVHFCWQPKSPTEREEAADEGEDDDLGTESEE